MLEKLKKVQEIIYNSILIKSTNITEHHITFSFVDGKSTTLNFDQNYLRDLNENNDHKLINISEKGAIPYLGNI